MWPSPVTVERATESAKELAVVKLETSSPSTRAAAETAADGLPVSRRSRMTAMGPTPDVLIERRSSEKICLRTCTLIIDPCPALRRKRAGQILFAHHPQSAQRPRVREDKIEQPTRGAFDRSSIRFNRLIELDLATRPITAFEVIYHT
jgi:hypothetical protein